MAESSVYQSGQPVPVTGIYEVAGAQTKSPTEKESPTRELKAGDLFPNFEGRAVTWHLKQKSGQANAMKQ
jgi:YjzC-like protein